MQQAVFLRVELLEPCPIAFEIKIVLVANNDYIDNVGKIHNILNSICAKVNENNTVGILDGTSIALSGR